MKHKTVWFPFIRYYTPEILAQFLNEMALEGWFPKNVSLLSYFCMIFVKAEKKEYDFAVDFNFMGSRKYRNFYNTFNWIHLGSMSNLNIWYKDADGTETPDIYTENESKIRNTRRYGLFILVVVMVAFLLFAASAVILVIGHSNMIPIKIILYAVGCAASLCVLVITLRQYTKLLKTLTPIDSSHK